MRMAIELGLHRATKSDKRTLDPYRIEVRKRVFWTAYLIDREVCMALGRPFAVAEHEIDVQVR